MGKLHFICPLARIMKTNEGTLCDTTCAWYDEQWDRCAVVKLVDIIEAIDNNGLWLDTKK